MSPPLSRTYWCHLDVRPPARPVPLPSVSGAPVFGGMTTPYPEVALIWMRAGVSDVAAELHAAAREEALARLEDPARTKTALRGLHRCRPLRFELRTATATWTWTVHPVLRLPLLTDGPRGPGLPPIVFWTQRP
ncbi:hypothetical protein [Streptomyces sp. MNP-20]|uniref:hypothetical protein n=1 Tax=Streptomyces sp. MNP-20 TaxID=2721165 RepID=UPI001555C38B|nr:hypothetical protein [Streptomyces sp. MNP-20]